MSPECVCEVSAQNNSQIIYYIILKMPNFEWKQKQTVLVHVSLNANELLPAPFSRIELCLYSSFLRYSAKKTSVWFCLSCITRWNHVLNHISLNIWNRVFWAHIFEARAQKAAVTWHKSTKVSSLSCLIELKMWNTHKFMLKTHELQNSRLCLWR